METQSKDLTNWTDPHASKWPTFLSEWIGQPDVRYLEIGVYKGDSLKWMLENILTHPSARAVAIDPFHEKYRQDFLRFIESHRDKLKVRAFAAASQEVLPRLQEKFDIIFVDGDHRASAVITDIVLAWRLLAPGGVLILDDFRWNKHWPLNLRPQRAIETFLMAFQNEIEVLKMGYQVIVKKTSQPLRNAWNLSPLKKGHYNWVTGCIETSENKTKLSWFKRILLEHCLRKKARKSANVGIT